MSQFIDRRTNSKNKSTVSRQRFLERFKKQIKESVSKALSNRSITDIQNGEKINISKKDVNEPFFHHGNGGEISRILPGNKEFITGDKIHKPPTSTKQGAGGNASDDGSGEDDFTFELNKDEFLDIFFEDLELPNLVKTELKSIQQYHNIRGGFSIYGSPTNMNITRSFRKALGRRIAFGLNKRKNLHLAKVRLQNLPDIIPSDAPRRVHLQQYIDFMSKKIAAIPFIDTSDILYNRISKQIIPSSQAVMFCIMDVSGSMDESKKELAKRFFILLYLFLTKTYQKIQIVFIRHHTTATEVDEHDFFYSRETGGTVVSSALELTAAIIEKRFPTNNWNIYVAQASDGDNWNADSPQCQNLLIEKIMPLVQYYAYIEIMPRHHQSLWLSYLNVKNNYTNFAMETIVKPAEIFSVLYELFKRK